MPDFTIVERTVAAHLERLGLKAVVVEEGVDTGCPMLGVFRTHAEVASTRDDAATAHIATIEMKAQGFHPIYGKIELTDRVTAGGPGEDAALRLAAEAYASTTLRGLLALHNQDYRTDLPVLELTSSETGITWTTVSSPFHVIGDPTGQFEGFLKANPPVNDLEKAIDALEPGCHWIKIFGSRGKSGEFTYGCTFDAEKSMECELYLAGGPDPGNAAPPGSEFRQFVFIEPKEVAEQEAWRTESHQPDGEVRNESFSTSAPHVKLNPIRYMRHSAIGCFFYPVLGLVAGAVACMLLKWYVAGVLLLLPALLIVGLAARVTLFARVKYQDALLSAGIVTQAKPLQVAVLTTLRNSSFAPTEGNVIKVYQWSNLPGHEHLPGTRVPCVAAFEGDASGESGYWKDFAADPISWGTGSASEIKRCEEKIGEEHFAELARHIAEGNLPAEPQKIHYLDRPNPSQPPPVPEGPPSGPPPLPPGPPPLT